MSMRKPVPTLATAVIALLLSAGAVAASPVTVSGAWIRLLPGNAPLGGYVTLHNHADQPITVVGAKSPAFKHIQMHHSMTMDGMDSMQPVDSVTIPADGQFKFAPGGYHLMMYRGDTSLHIGESVPVTLEFADGGQLKIAFTVKGPTQ